MCGFLRWRDEGRLRPWAPSLPGSGCLRFFAGSIWTTHRALQSSDTIFPFAPSVFYIP
jgi:hypothetical protein